MQATDNVDTILGAVRSLSLISYISYNVTDKEFVAFGLNDPELTIKMAYSTRNGDGNVGGVAGTCCCVSPATRRKSRPIMKPSKKARMISPMLPVTCELDSRRSFMEFLRAYMIG